MHTRTFSNLVSSVTQMSWYFYPIFASVSLTSFQYAQLCTSPSPSRDEEYKTGLVERKRRKTAHAVYSVIAGGRCAGDGVRLELSSNNHSSGRKACTAKHVTSLECVFHLITRFSFIFSSLPSFSLSNL